jgi:hypothetical protein
MGFVEATGRVIVVRLRPRPPLEITCAPAVDPVLIGTFRPSSSVTRSVPRPVLAEWMMSNESAAISGVNVVAVVTVLGHCRIVPLRL